MILIFTFYIITAYFNQFSPFSSSRVTAISRPCSSSSADLSSVQLQSPIIPHHKSRVNFVIRIYINYLFHRPPSGYHISYQFLLHPIISAYFCSFLAPPPHIRPYSSSSTALYCLLSRHRSSSYHIPVHWTFPQHHTLLQFIIHPLIRKADQIIDY